MDPLHTLLDGLIDYAGLFPPSALPIDRAAANYIQYKTGPHAYALGRFVIPVLRLRELEPHLNGEPVQLSVLANPLLDPDLELITAFHSRMQGRAVVDTLEIKVNTPEEIELMDAPAGMTVYAEVPIDGRLTDMVTAARQSGVRLKIRTGGLIATAFPVSAEIARFLAECARQQCPFKATAGLHHPVRCYHALTYEKDSPQGWMHGFLNVFLAAALAKRGAPEIELAELLDESNASSFWRDEHSINWRHHRFIAEDLSDTRSNLAASFGSCSFEEPIDDLRNLGWL
jgi:hypothetical protein